MDPRPEKKSAAAALALACFLAEYNWPLRVPTGKMSPSELWNCSDRLLAGMLKLPFHEIPRLQAFRRGFSDKRIFEQMSRSQIAVITLGEEAYPPSLAQIHDPPPALFLRGPQTRLATMMERKRIAMVGARVCSRYGLDAAIKIAGDLSRHGACIVSGMALGIDAAAHRGALEGEGSSIAVLGGGVDVVYPRANRQLYGSLVERGLVVSEYPPGTRPMPWRFPARNRIMAGLADAVIVVEAREKSGALITADFCLEEGREVLAVPGSIFSELSAGPHALLRSGATAVTSAGEALESLGVEIPPQRLPVEAAAVSGSLTGIEERLLQALDGRPRHQDLLAERVGIDGASAAAALVSLELRGLIRLDPGRGYCR